MNSLLEAWRHSPTHRRVWALAAPMILSNVSVPLVTLVDSAVIGHLPHAHQLGAVAVGGGLYTLLVGVLGFLRMGTTGFAAQATGRDDGGALRRILGQSLLLALGLALLLGLLAIPLTGPVLALMRPSAELDSWLASSSTSACSACRQRWPPTRWSAGSSGRRTPARHWRSC